VTQALLAASAFVAGIMAAAPMGPVNMLAIRRGLILHWTRALWVGTGCVALETSYIALGFWGGAQIMEKLPAKTFRQWVGLPGAAIILMIGVLILLKAARAPRRGLAARMAGTPPGPTSRLRDVLTGAALTLINPAVLLYWLGVGSKLIAKAGIPAGSAGVWYGVAAASAGLSCWFVSVSLLIRLRPQRVGPNFLRAVNAVCGGLLTILGIVLGVQLLL